MEVYTGKQEAVHIAVMPSPGVGHLNPLLEFTKRLIQLDPRSFAITFIIIPTNCEDIKLSKIQTSFLVTLPEGAQVDFLSLPPPVFDSSYTLLEEEIVARMYLTVQRSLSSLRGVLINLSNTLKGPVSSLVVDILGTHAFNVAFELGIEPYICFPSSASFLSFMIQMPEMDRMVSGEFTEMEEPLKLPGTCKLIPTKDLPNPVLQRKTSKYRWFLEHSKQYCLAKGIIVNSFDALEGDALTALRSLGDGKPTIYPVGPLTKMVSREDVDININIKRDSRCLKWLDDQPKKPVIYVNFGSSGTLSSSQICEIALGLELSGVRFLWVVRVPNESTSFGSYITIDEEKDPLHFLPEKFLERTKERGLVVPNWCPQIQILSHRATGGFLTHCGWNSILESLVNGIPFIAWPLFAEQKMNALFLEEDLKVAFRVTSDGLLVGHEQIARLVKALMIADQGGKEICMKTIQAEAVKAMGEDGTSTTALVKLANEFLINSRQHK